VRTDAIIPVQRRKPSFHITRAFHVPEVTCAAAKLSSQERAADRTQSIEQPCCSIWETVTLARPGSPLDETSRPLAGLTNHQPGGHRHPLGSDRTALAA